MSKEFLLQNYANTQLSLRFSTNTIMKYKEVQVVISKIICFNSQCSSIIVLTSLQVFDFADIIGSVGGSLGLFLGFSCLASAQALLRKL